MTPVLIDKRTRDRYDTLWSLWPWTHPLAYWLRSNGSEVLCTRCSAATTSMPRSVEDDPESVATEFVAVHLQCPEGFGLRGSKPQDPLFAT